MPGAVHGGAKLVAILGGSGSGKVVAAQGGGFAAPRARQGEFLVAPPFRPGSDPVRGLLGALHGIDLSLTRARPRRHRRSREDALALIDRLRLKANAPQATLIIAVGSGGEAFIRASKDVHEKFFKLLSALVADDHPALGI